MWPTLLSLNTVTDGESASGTVSRPPLVLLWLLPTPPPLLSIAAGADASALRGEGNGACSSRSALDGFGCDAPHPICRTNTSRKAKSLEFTPKPLWNVNVQ